MVLGSIKAMNIQMPQVSHTEILVFQRGLKFLDTSQKLSIAWKVKMGNYRNVPNLKLSKGINGDTINGKIHRILQP